MTEDTQKFPADRRPWEYKPVYAHIAEAVAWRERINDEGHLQIWKQRAASVIDSIASDALPNGSGFDTTPQIVTEQCTQRKIVITGSFHRMDENGYYDGWADFTITVHARFYSIDLDVAFSDPSDDEDADEQLVEYIAETYYNALNAMRWADEFRYWIESPKPEVTSTKGV